MGLGTKRGRDGGHDIPWVHRRDGIVGHASDGKVRVRRGRGNPDRQ
jgi:hypothetical protein